VGAISQVKTCKSLSMMFSRCLDPSCIPNPVPINVPTASFMDLLQSLTVDLSRVRDTAVVLTRLIQSMKVNSKLTSFSLQGPSSSVKISANTICELFFKLSKLEELQEMKFKFRFILEEEDNEPNLLNVFTYYLRNMTNLRTLSLHAIFNNRMIQELDDNYAKLQVLSALKSLKFLRDLWFCWSFAVHSGASELNNFTANLRNIRVKGLSNSNGSSISIASSKYAMIC